MKIIFTPIAMEHWEYWKKNHPTIAKRIKKLLIAISEHPRTGIGKPEPLRHQLSGKWSRRIDTTHRIVYAIDEDRNEVYIFSMKYHYPKNG